MPSLFFKYCLLTALSLPVMRCFAQGDLLITPKRLVFDGSKRAEEINLANIGKDTATYNISFVQFKMDDNGVFTPVSEDDTTLHFANKNLRFFPRTVTLAPHEAQTIKVQLIKANELSQGEYRSHLFFKNVLNTTALGEEKPLAGDSGISVSLKPVFGISIATIIRVGETSVESSLSDVRFSYGAVAAEPLVNFTINRKGNISLYGDIQVNYVSTDNITTQVGIMKGVAVYTPNTFRHVQLPLKKAATIDYNKGKLVLTYTDPAAKNQVIARSEINL